MRNSIVPGALVYWKGDAAIVIELKGFSELIVRYVKDGRTDLVRTKDVSTQILHPDQSMNGGSHLDAVDKEWDLALKRYEMIKPLLDLKHRTEIDVGRVAREHGIGVTTVYRWLKRFEESGLVSSLLRQKRADKGDTKLDIEVEQLIKIQIQKVYLKEERPSVLKLFRIIKAECIAADLPVPHKNTVYSRVRAIECEEAVRRRLGPRSARQKYEPKTGSFPGADYPNAVVQIDHTPVDLIVVDEQHRLPIGRPYLTIAIDVATKMISGFKLTLDPPGASSAGLCIAHAILPKENWLAKRNITAEWPIYGKMQKIHVDNAKEFRGNMLRRACQQHGVILEFRPKGQPNYGPHVERAFKTFMQEVQSLPGTTFSSVKDKVDYNSEGKACMTLNELELWFTTFLLYCYHHRPHKGINQIPPIKLYTEYVFGNGDRPGIGLPPPIVDEETLRLDFTPYVLRTVQRQGVEIDHIHYYSDVLRKWIGSVDECDRKRKRKFIFARDPRDISKVYFWDPDTSKYVSIPYLNSSRPSVSLWELQAVTKSIREKESYFVDEDTIFSGIQRMREIEDKAIERTRLSRQQRASEKRRRRMSERRKNWNAGNVVNSTKRAEEAHEEDDSLEDIQPFSDVEIY